MSTGFVPPTPTDPPPTGTDRRAAPKVVALLTAGLGVAIIVGAVTTTALPTFASAVSHSEERFVSVDGVSALDIDVIAMGLTVVFDDVDEASLDVRDSGGGRWTFERDDAVLRVSTPRAPFVSWFAGGNGTATLTLPAELAGLDAQLAVSGGSFDAEGEFGEVNLELAAGQVTIGGAADTLLADVSAGRGEIALDDVSSAELTLGTGELIASLGGTAPSTVTASVSAGSLDLTLPDEEYDVTTDVSAGDVDNRLRTDSGARRTVFVEVAAGNARLTPGH